jgi:oryzin
MSAVTSMLSRRDLPGIGAQYDMTELKGYQVTADTAAIVEIARAPEVAYIEKDAAVTLSVVTSQTDVQYGLSRISHRSRNFTTYIYDSSAGDGVTVYVVDTGIYTSHSQFGGRASFGANFISGSPVFPPWPPMNAC